MSFTVYYGPKTQAYYERMRKVLTTTTVDINRPVISSAHGVYFVDLDGNSGMDFTSQVGVAIHHTPVEFLKTAGIQLDRLNACLSNDFQFSSVHDDGYLSEIEVSPVKLAEELARKTPVMAPKKVLFEVSGATAINAAVKLCLNKFRLPSGKLSRNAFAAFHGAFHGRHGTSLDLSSSKKVHKLLHVSGLNVVRLNFPLADRNYDGRYLDEVRSLLDLEEEKCGKLAALFVEIVQGEGGINFASSKALSYLHAETERRGMVFVVDEIQTGFGRTGRMFASEYLAFNPDMIVSSKSLGGGLAIGCVIYNSDIISDLPFGAHSGTMPAHPLSVALGEATLRIISDNNLVSNSAKVGQYMLEKLKKVFYGHNVARNMVERIEGKGLMCGVEFRTPEQCHNIVKTGLMHRPILLLIEAGYKTIRFMPPLSASCGDIDKCMEILGGEKGVLNSLKP